MADNDTSQPKLTVENVYSVEWSDEDGEYVATTPAYPSLSWLDPSPVAALSGLLDLINPPGSPS